MAKISRKAEGIYEKVSVRRYEWHGVVTHRSCPKDSANRPEHIVRILIRQERNDEVANCHSDESIRKHWLGRVEVGHTAPEQEE